MADQPESAVRPPSHSKPSTPNTQPTAKVVFPNRLPPSPAETDWTESDIESGSISSGTELGDDSKWQRPYPLPPAAKPVSVLMEDLKTPDRHVQRDPRLIRLTGVHPFNVEPPMTELYQEGFLTTKNLHFVRNHGAVPEVQDADVMDWDFSIEGMVKKPMKMTLRQLLADYEQLTYPVTLVCAGNRRKEQNIVRKTNGFSWGASGLSTALWTGVALSDLLERAKPVRGAMYVRFEGADKLPNGHYGTSVKLAWARNSERGILVAYKMNGEPLPPDHGKPLRVVVPGNIGGRSVKWLKRIIVAAEPSDSWYHIYDNRVLPTMISPEASADLPDMWRDERYAIYDLNTNSAICFPAHEERIQLARSGGGGQTYNVRGYAYAGGGKRVTRVEVTLDRGRSWRLADVEYPEDRYRLAAEGEMLYGGRIDVMGERSTSFCWCFWNVDVSVADLQTADDLMVRSMDDSMMVQPRDMYWSVLGMMNNPWFRVVIHKAQSGNDDMLWFEHPAPPRSTEHGWMERVKKAGGNLTNSFWGEKTGGEPEGEDRDIETAARDRQKAEAAQEICMTDETKTGHVVTLEELQAHNNEDEPWFVVQGHVYDGTEFLSGHPGGAPSITAAAAQDVTEEFMAIHSEKAKRMMAAYHVGVLDKAAVAALGGGEAADKAENEQQRPVFLQSRRWSKALLTAKTAVSADTKIFSFRLDHADQLLGLPVGQHLMVRLRDPATREAFMRAYTPLSMDLPGQPARGVLDMLIKIYHDKPGQPGGRMTQALNALPIGHAVDFKGPIGHFAYLGHGCCAIGSGKAVRHRQVRRFVMVCGGSGITPVFQVLRTVLATSAADDPTQCLLLDGNRTEADILCRAELDALAVAHPDRFRVVHVLSRPEKHGSWTGLCGLMDAAFFQREVGQPRPATASNSSDNNVLVLVCGPEPMEASVRQIFLDMGWSKENMHFF
ncbi:nitrate reductase [Grosmannia clavigera kw1407]|uniref:Nitrate reductase [NADPH] n=1 Tax=Grosmannia clavigera (strain kw1407 / UAMH 11150) TaxID=655863 RepID=F0X946_GROCL|nr:nitrate reductase [Grosmannia clavigera kw1407]EFX05421.1 nitrate reductase [Grosmannia clavigera kw1407]